MLKSNSLTTPKIRDLETQISQQCQIVRQLFMESSIEPSIANAMTEQYKLLSELGAWEKRMSLPQCAVLQPLKTCPMPHLPGNMILFSIKRGAVKS